MIHFTPYNILFTFLIAFLFTPFEKIYGQNNDNFPVELLPISTNSNSSKSQIIEHSYYTVSYNEKHEQANWVAYELTSQELIKNTSRTNDFRADQDVTSSSAELDDYKGSGYDRGHLAPAADMSFTSKAMTESFYFSNMSPQDPSFNRGIWKQLEEQFRAWAHEKHNIYIITGPILEDGLITIGANNVSVPNYYYKIAVHYNSQDNEYEAIAFLLPNKKGDQKLSEYIVTIDSIESLTQLDFFSTLSDSLQITFESTLSKGDWNYSSIYNPISNNQQTTNKVNTATDQNENNTKVRCGGITKSGSQCKRYTTDSSGFCWQHKK
ncbi:DNA/RNA non-specific endonuclease [Flammeovirga kamogawensis]|uniref:Endonuclease n=1 Tax=Flammeovirga kamogawensis TaxID=373891 RepID=A0ABX8GW82_9BACT|nr:DNA/RNA non-specific endonuclease [Flammeovirga kamogawensis]MBB6461236.1 endonuclease G [Flammeovirga kamogawensis]QWG07796.1 DNA/RNA non-specific endonuclease [Flammeovirga kamogawensis]TRX69602.1 DNA/RNA non-specific endonuclease [Flammeovirga kamogawensis]